MEITTNNKNQLALYVLAALLVVMQAVLIIREASYGTVGNNWWFHAYTLSFVGFIVTTDLSKIRPRYTKREVLQELFLVLMFFFIGYSVAKTW